MIQPEKAVQMLGDVVRRGEKLGVAGHADLRAVKQLLDQCLQNNIPAMLGPCSKGG